MEKIVGPIKVGLDFDGTCVTHEYPKIGKDIGAVPILIDLVNRGHLIILYTMRSGNHLADAINWFAENGISLYAAQKDPGQERWTSSNKCYANLYIGDDALGCPLVYDPELSSRPYADWDVIRKMLIEKGLI